MKDSTPTHISSTLQFLGLEEIVWYTVDRSSRPWKGRWEVCARKYKPNPNAATPTLGPVEPLLIIERKERKRA